MNLIGITGIAGSGKSTVASMLNKELGGKYAIKNFADPIKDTLSLYFGLTRNQIEDRTIKESPIPGFEDITPRSFMEGLGESLRGTFGEDIWVRLMMNRYNREIDLNKSISVFTKEEVAYPLWIIADMRKPIEADAVKSYGGQIIKVVNPKVKPRGLASETEIEQIIPDYIIYNDSSFFDLEFKVKKMVEQLYVQ